MIIFLCADTLWINYIFWTFWALMVSSTSFNYLHWTAELTHNTFGETHWNLMIGVIAECLCVDRVLCLQHHQKQDQPGPGSHRHLLTSSQSVVEYFAPVTTQQIYPERSCDQSDNNQWTTYIFAPHLLPRLKCQKLRSSQMFSVFFFSLKCFWTNNLRNSAWNHIVPFENSLTLYNVKCFWLKVYKLFAPFMSL